MFHQVYKISHTLFAGGGQGESSNGIVANALDCNILVSEFELQSFYCIFFQTNALVKDMNPISVSMC